MKKISRYIWDVCTLAAIIATLMYSLVVQEKLEGRLAQLEVDPKWEFLIYDSNGEWLGVLPEFDWACKGGYLYSVDALLSFDIIQRDDYNLPLQCEERPVAHYGGEMGYHL